MIDRHVRADRVLAGIEMLEQEVAAGVLDVAHPDRGTRHRSSLNVGGSAIGGELGAVTERR